MSSIVVFAGCALGVALCREIMIDEVERRMPADERLGHPRLSFNYSRIVRLHAEFYPESRVRALSRFLFGLGALIMGSLVLGSFVCVLFRSAHPH
jgi:TRAP-type C4-dicarboxylate transport system permease small subunit